MNAKYVEWIKNNVDSKHCAGECGIKSREMCDEFPELMFIEGRYYKISEDKKEAHGYGHCWCVTKDGKIIDPTVAQFEDDGQGRYVPKAELEYAFS